MPNTTNTNIIFRTKFKKHIICDAEHHVFLDAFKKFINMDAETAIDMLWKLTYEPYSPVLWDIGLCPESFHEAMISTLRNELRYQYEEHHPNFLFIEVGDECREAFTELSNQANSIVSRIVYNVCSLNLFVHELEMNRMLFLLESDKENQYFGGIRSLGFSSPEADYLKPFHMQIHNLLKAMYDVHKKQQSSPLDTPFENLAQKIEETENDLPFSWSNSPKVESVSVDKPVQCNSTYRRIIAETVILHKDVFTSFVYNNDMNALIQISELGFDLNEVISKREKILNLLNAITEKEKVEQKLFEAHEAFNS